MTTHVVATMTAEEELTPVARHLADLQAQGIALRAIAEAAGVDNAAVWRIRHSRRRPGSQIEARLLTVTASQVFARANLNGLVPSVGARRRLQALMAISWSRDDLTARLGFNAGRILRSSRRSVEAATHVAVAELYRRLKDTPGPSKAAAVHAERLNYAPPLAWVGLDMDDPTAMPSLAASPEPGSPAEAAWLIAAGRDVDDIAAARGIQPRAVTRALERARREAS